MITEPKTRCNQREFLPPNAPLIALAMIILAQTLGDCSIRATNLLQQSSVCMRTRGWYLSGPHLDITPQWTCSGEVVFGMRYGEPTNPQFRLCVRDIKTGRQRAYNAIMHAVDRTRGMMSSVLPSYDGAHLLWWSDGRFYTGNIRGSKAHRALEADVENWTSPVWLPGGKRWAAVYPEPDSGLTSHKVLLVTVCDVDGHTLPQSARIRVTAHGPNTYYKISPGPSGQLSLLQISGRTGRLSVRTIATLRYLPNSGVRLYPVNRMRWTISEINSGYIVPFSDAVAWISRDKGSGIRGRNGSILSLWVANLSNGHRYVVGRLFAKYKDGHEDRLQCVAWLPDGRRLSYIYGETLYTVKTNILTPQRGVHSDNN